MSEKNVLLEEIEYQAQKMLLKIKGKNCCICEHQADMVGFFEINLEEKLRYFGYYICEKHRNDKYIPNIESWIKYQLAQIDLGPRIN